MQVSACKLSCSTANQSPPRLQPIKWRRLITELQSIYWIIYQLFTSLQFLSIILLLFVKMSCFRKVHFETENLKNLSMHAHNIQCANFSRYPTNSPTKIIHPNVCDQVEALKMKNPWTVFLKCSLYSDSHCCSCFLLCDGHFGIKSCWLLKTIALLQLLEMKAARGTSLKWHFGRAGNNAVSETLVFQGALAK